MNEPGKWVCVVGATGGIGSAIVAHALDSGYPSLLCMDRDAPALERLARERGVIGLPCDVADVESVSEAFRAARQHAGGLYGLVVAAGVVDTHGLGELTAARWRQVLDVNLSGTFHCCLAARDWLVDGGRIVTLSSTAGKTGGGITGPAYAASKGGVEALTKSLAQELAARRITANCIAPGAVDTPMLASHPPRRRQALLDATPLRRFAAPREIAAAALYLLGEDAAFTTGTVLAVNGGLRMD